MFRTVPQKILLLLTLYALLLSASGFILEHFFNAIPCHMCWWQRYIHWALAGAGIMAVVLNKPKRGLVLLTVIAGLGLYVAIWQVLVQQGILAAPASCGQPTGEVFGNSTDLLSALNAGNVLPPKCDEVNFTMFGYSLAVWNILAMGFTMIAAIIGLKRKAKVWATS